MEMTIDKTIEFYNGLECYTPQAKDAKNVAIDTMCKYQKIVQIMERTVDDGTLICMMMIWTLSVVISLILMRLSNRKSTN